MLNFYVCPKLACYICRGLEACLHILPSILDFLWRELFSDSSFSMAHSLQGPGFTWFWAFLPSAYSFVPFCNLAIISCCTTLPFLLWRYLTPACWASLGLLLILLSITQCGHLGFVLHCLWALLSHLFSLRHPWLICFPWGLLGPFSNSAFPWVFTNSFRLPWPNYLILHP